MNPYLMMVACSCVVSAVCAGYVLARGARPPETWLSTCILAGSSYWAMCEVAAGMSADAETALWWLRASSVGWMFIGPLVVHMLIRVHQLSTPLRYWLPVAYAASAGFLVLTFSTDTIMERPVRTSWGWTFQPGTLHPLYYATLMACVLGALTLLRAIVRAGPRQNVPRQSPLVTAALFIPSTLASITDVFLPWAGIHVPRLGATSFALLGLAAVSVDRRRGHSLLSPETFAEGILSSLNQGVALLHRDGRIRAANEGLARLAKRSRAELETLSVHEVLVSGFQDPGQEMEENEAELATASGGRIPVAVTSRAMRDKQGQLVGLVVSVHDLREVETLRSGLVTSARLAAVGQLAAGIAHEINNPLAFVRSNLNQLHDHWKAVREELKDLPRHTLERVAETRELIEESLEGVDRAAEIVRGVKSFSHADSSFRQDADLNALLDEVVVMATPQLRGRVTVERCYSDLPAIHAAPQQLKQVFLNMVVNGAQAAGDGGHLRIATHLRGAWVSVEIEDDGEGIAPEIRSRIFEPFFTTKAVGEGTGLGLAIAYEIVRSHGGKIEVDSQPGQGSCFRVRLPARSAD
jgi:signal transduction histidine kinase